MYTDIGRQLIRSYWTTAQYGTYCTGAEMDAIDCVLAAIVASYRVWGQHMHISRVWCYERTLITSLVPRTLTLGMTTYTTDVGHITKSRYLPEQDTNSACTTIITPLTL